VDYSSSGPPLHSNSSSKHPMSRVRERRTWRREQPEGRQEATLPSASRSSLAVSFDAIIHPKALVRPARSSTNLRSDTKSGCGRAFHSVGFIVKGGWREVRSLGDGLTSPRKWLRKRVLNEIHDLAPQYSDSACPHNCAGAFDLHTNLMSAPIVATVFARIVRHRVERIFPLIRRTSRPCLRLLKLRAYREESTRRSE